MKNKLVLFVSITFNLVLIVVLFLNKQKTPLTDSELKELNDLEKEKSKQYSIDNNFKEIFIQKNDSIYKDVFSYSFENSPLNAFFLSSTYYLLTKDTSTFKDIRISSSQLESIYGEAPDISEITK